MEDRNHQLSHGIAARRQVSLFPGLNGIKQQQRAVRIVYFINQTDEISNDLSVFLIVNPADGFISRVGDLFRFSESLIFGMNFPVFLSKIAASL